MAKTTLKSNAQKTMHKQSIKKAARPPCARKLLKEGFGV
jgi:hypothetical protein